MSRVVKDREKLLQDKLQMILSALLRDEDNKYCVDCDAKGPRWASWNLGIFLCIRCAGIHRNLGVHISKVKSVNLDTWTPEQVATIKDMGNSRARAVFEANVPEGFRRPQSDSALEAFIRTKYEQRKYVAREWVPDLHPNVGSLGLDDILADSKSRAPPSSSAVPRPVSEKSKSAGVSARPTASNGASALKSTSNESSKSGTVAPPAPKPPAAPPAPSPPAAPSSSDVDLLSLDEPALKDPAPVLVETATPVPAPAPTHDPFKGLLCDTSPIPSSNSTAAFSTSGVAPSPASKPVTKDSIMALYGSSSGHQSSPHPGGPPFGGHHTPPLGHFPPNMPVGASPVNRGFNVPSPYGPAAYNNAAPAPAFGTYSYMQAPPHQQLHQQQQNQQLHLQQVQQQLANLKMNGGTAQNAAGATLSNNLWQ